VGGRKRISASSTRADCGSSRGGAGGGCRAPAWLLMITTSAEPLGFPVCRVGRWRARDDASDVVEHDEGRDGCSRRWTDHHVVARSAGGGEQESGRDLSHGTSLARSRNPIASGSTLCRNPDSCAGRHRRPGPRREASARGAGARPAAPRLLDRRAGRGGKRATCATFGAGSNCELQTRLPALWSMRELPWDRARELSPTSPS